MSSSISALITIRNRPRVSSTTHAVTRVKIGFTIAFTMPKIRATTSSVSTFRPVRWRSQGDAAEQPGRHGQRPGVGQQPQENLTAYALPLLVGDRGVVAVTSLHDGRPGQGEQLVDDALSPAARRSLKLRPVAPGPPLNRVSPVKTVARSVGVEADRPRRVARGVQHGQGRCRRSRSAGRRPARHRAGRRGSGCHSGRSSGCSRTGAPTAAPSSGRHPDVVVVRVGAEDRPDHPAAHQVEDRLRCRGAHR